MRRLAYDLCSEAGDSFCRSRLPAASGLSEALHNICKEFATKALPNVMNWGMVPFQMEADPELKYRDYIYVPASVLPLTGI